LSTQTLIDNDADRNAYIELQQQFEQTGLSVEEIEKQHKAFNEACARIFR
jgi:hypothetical protein